MRVVFLIVVALLVLTLGGLEVIASRRLPVADRCRTPLCRLPGTGDRSEQGAAEAIVRRRRR